MSESSPRRLVPDLEFPPYSYVPGRFPHPMSDPKGHSFGIKAPPCQPPDPNRWRDCRTYLAGVDLFNHGYYWEAHEAWEGLWHACGRKGPTADFLKGLIHLAAAGVKVRQRESRGVRNHAHRAVELLSEVPSRYMGLDLKPLMLGIATVAAEPLTPARAETSAVVVFPFALLPRMT